MAKDIKLIVAAQTDRANAALVELQRTGTNTASVLEREFTQLGVKSSLAFEGQRKAADAAYQRIKTSGLATSDELERGQRAHAAAMTRIDEEQHGKRLTLLQQFKTHWIGVTATLAAAWATASKAIDLARAGAAAQAQGTAFANLAASYGQSADQIVADLQRVSHGTISVQQSVEQAGKAMVLGVGAEHLPKLMEMARASARITGETTTKAFNDLVEGVAKGSAELLNNLGIIVRAEDAYKKYASAHNLVAAALTAEQKQQAILNEVLQQGNDIVERAGDLGESEAEKLAKFSASIDNMGKSIGVLLSGPVSSLAEELGATVGWLEAYSSGQIGFFEWMFTGADSAAEKLKALKKTQLDALVTPEGQALAQRKAEEAARKAEEEAKVTAVAVAKVQQEEADKASAKAATEREKRLTEIRQHNARILEIEKKAIAQREQAEAEHLKKTTSDYEAAVRAMDSLIDARASVKAQLENRSAADAARNAPQKDALTAYLDQQQQIKEAEQRIAGAFGQSAEAKSKAYADLLDKAAEYNKAVEMGGVEIVSALQTEATYQETKERLQRQINALFEQEGQKRTAAAETFAEQMLIAQGNVKAFESEMTALETVLDRLNHKEIEIIFKASGYQDLMSAAGGSTISGLGSIASVPGWSNLSGTFAVGTRYVPRTGVYQLHQGEEVRTRGEVSAGRSAAPITLAPIFQVTISEAQSAQATARELARAVLPELQTLMTRYRTA